jgi:hypothetical protein
MANKEPVESVNNKGTSSKTSFKYIPLELASAKSVKHTIAKNILYDALGHGMLVIKYGTSFFN